jgi:hypothetical protein
LLDKIIKVDIILQGVSKVLKISEHSKDELSNVQNPWFNFLFAKKEINQI